MDLNLRYCTIYDSKLIGISTTRPTVDIKRTSATATWSKVSPCSITLVSFDLITQDIWGLLRVSGDVLPQNSLQQGTTCGILSGQIVHFADSRPQTRTLVRVNDQLDGQLRYIKRLLL